MSLITLRLLWCDFDGCEEELGPEPYAQTLRERAKAHGWVRVDGRDLCENHAGEASL